MPTDNEDPPSTIARSPDKVKRTYAKTLDSAHDTYDGDEERAHRTAYAAVKHVAEKRGDHWELKDRPGPSDPQAAQSGAPSRERPRETFGGVDAGKSKRALYEDAREAGIAGRSKLSKTELARALDRHSQRESASARR